MGKEVIDSKTLYELKNQIKSLKKFKGRGTELISVYVSEGYPLHEITAKLRDEYGQASNIKSKTTQKNVQGALEKIIQYLKNFKSTPKNGIAVFCGNLSQEVGKSDIRLFSIIPPSPLTVQFYRCESQFTLDPLEEMLGHQDSYGIVVMDGSDATVAVLKGKKIKIIKKVHSTAPSKVFKGGQSAARYQRLREEGIAYYFKRIGEAMDAFLNIKNFKGVIVGGPGPVKENFLKSNTFNYQLKILGVVDTGYTDEQGIKEAMEKASDIIAEQEAVKEKQLVNEFMKRVVKGGLAVYGYNDVKEALENYQVGKLLVSEGEAVKKYTLKCNKCGKVKTVIAMEKPHKKCSCGGYFEVEKEEDIIEELIEMAEKQGVKIEMISEDTAEGAEFKATFKGVGAFLRYKVS